MRELGDFASVPSSVWDRFGSQRRAGELVWLRCRNEAPRQ